MSLAPAGPHPNPLPKGEGDLDSFGAVGHFAGRAGMTTPPGANRPYKRFSRVWRGPAIPVERPGHASGPIARAGWCRHTKV